MNSFKLLLSFFTRIPVGNVDFSEEEFIKGIKYTPIVGLVIGTILLLIAGMLSNKVDSEVRAFLIVMVYIFVTGGLHLDGLSDTCDGIFSNRSPERILEIMKDSRVGSFGVLSLIILLLGDIIFISKASLLSILFFPIIGRIAIVLACKFSNYSRSEGMGKSFIENGGNKDSIVTVSICSIIMIILAVILGQAHIIIGIIITYILSYFIIKNISKKINGITGDVLGFIAEISQLIFLITVYLGRVL